MQETEEKMLIYNSDPQKDKVLHPWNKKRIFFEIEQPENLNLETKNKIAGIKIQLKSWEM